MKTRSYYSFDDGSEPSPSTCSRASDAAPLIVNCAGSFFADFPFTTDNPTGRLDYYLMHVTTGTLRIKTNDDWVSANAGDTVVIPPSHPYTYTYEGGETLGYLWTHFTGSAAKFYLDEMGMSPLPFVRHSSRENRAMHHFLAMFDVFSEESATQIHALAARLIQILTEISRSFGKEEENPLLRSLRYIDASYTEDIRVPQLAAMENLSNSRYSVIFKRHTGMSPGAYIIDLRMRHACELLRTTDMSVKQIGILVGYEDPLFFSKLFKNKTGMSPTQYRKS